MRRPALRPRLVRPGLPASAAGFAALGILIGALFWFRPYLTGTELPVAEVPDAAPLFATTPFLVRPGGRACMSSVTITPKSQLAQFVVRPASPSPKGGPTIELALSAPGYESSLTVPGGYPGGSVALPFRPPRRAEIGTACFINKGRSTASLNGSTEARTVSRTGMLIDGKSVVGDIALTFLQREPVAPIHELGEWFTHASRLTDGLIPSWLIWIAAALAALGVPAGIVAALYLALRDDPALGRLTGGAGREC